MVDATDARRDARANGTPKLLPCPFCGSTNVEVRFVDGWLFAVCVVCDARPGIRHGILSSRTFEEARELAAGDWNKRATGPNGRLVPALERARSCIKGLLGRTPVRDVAETLAEVDAALAAAKETT